MGKGLSDVFTFWLNQMNKLFDLLKQVPVFEKVSLFHTIIALCLIAIFIKIIRFGFNFKPIKGNNIYNRHLTERSDDRWLYFIIMLILFS